MSFLAFIIFSRHEINEGKRDTAEHDPVKLFGVGMENVELERDLVSRASKKKVCTKLRFAGICSRQ